MLTHLSLLLPHQGSSVCSAVLCQVTHHRGSQQVYIPSKPEEEHIYTTTP